MSDTPSDVGTGTVIDRSLGRARLKEGLIPARTGIYLQIENGPAVGSVFDLSKGGVYLIGRSGTDIALGDPKVSRKHAEIGLYGPDAYQLRDLASTNGTLLNGRSVNDKVKLKNGDAIQVGDTILTFMIIQGSIVVPEKG